MLVFEGPVSGLAWGDVLRRVPGATLDARVEGVDLRHGRYALRVLQRVRGLPQDALDEVRAALLARYPDAEFKVVQPPGPDGVLLRTRLDVDAFADPAVRFILRFHDQATDILVHIEGDRVCLRATPILASTAPEMLERIKAFLAKHGARDATIRLGGPCKCQDPRLPALPS